MALIGSKLYDLLLCANRIVSYIRYKLGLSYWSLAAAIRHKVKDAVNYISNFETTVSQMAKQHNVDGICGYIDCAEIHQVNDVLYCNCGD